MKRNVYAKRKVMKDVAVNKSSEIKYWTELFESCYPACPIPVGFIYDVAWAEIANRKLLEQCDKESIK